MNIDMIKMSRLFWKVFDYATGLDALMREYYAGRTMKRAAERISLVGVETLVNDSEENLCSENLVQLPIESYIEKKDINTAAYNTSLSSDL